MICVSILATSNEEMLQQFAAAGPQADLIEMRIDGIPEPDLPRLLAARPRPVIVTNRPLSEGGRFTGSERRRLELLEQAMKLGAEHVDVELEAAPNLPRHGNTRRIVSYHNFANTPSDLQEIYQRIIRSGAEIAKIAVTANDICDNLHLFDLLKKAIIPTIALCMGERGQISRILSAKFGGYLTFASAEKGRESATGQLTAKELRELYRYPKINRDTQVYGVIAKPVAHSLSPIIHNAAFAALGINAVYLPFLVDDVVRFVREFRAIPVKGYSVTIPHKEAVIAAMDEIDPFVKKIGAMNTILERDGRLCGHNTDWLGAIRSLEEALGEGASLRGKKAVLLGAGGAARAVAYGLQQRGAHVIVVNRTYERGVRLARELECECRPREELSQLDYDLLINTTSVGMHPNSDETPVPREALRRGTIVLDAVYNPPETRLLREATEAGCRTISGVSWFVNQAAAQFELWTGRTAPKELMVKVFRERLAPSTSTN